MNLHPTSRCPATLAIFLTARLLWSAADPLPQVINGTPGVADSRAVANFSELLKQQAALQAVTRTQNPAPRFVPPRKRGNASSSALQPRAAAQNAKSGGRQSPSPAMTSSFLALGDDNTSIPPDTTGAVGPNHLMTTLNTQVRIQNKSGVTLSTVSLNSFWSPVGGSPDAFDPRVTYDPYSNRWIISSGADSGLSSSSILVGVSQTSDPTGTWFLYKVDVDSGNAFSADYPTLGFNKDWIVVSVNMFPNNLGNSYVNIYVFNKTNLYAGGTGLHTFLQDTSGAGFTLSPAVTYDNSLSALYLVEDFDNTQAQLRISRITGAVGSETLTLGYATATGAGAWDFGGNGDFLPQAGTSRQIDAGDSRILNCVYRNGSLWAAQTSFLPAVSPTHTAAQWWQMSTNGSVQQFGRLEDAAAATSYAYPAIAVNKNNDVLLGYSRFSSTQYASGNYAFRTASDPAGTLRDDTVLKAGESCYVKALGGANNRWGDYSGAAVDPVDDVAMWTIVEYAATSTGGCSDGSGRWGTWWGRVIAGAIVNIDSTTLIAEGCLPTNGVIDPGETVTVSFALKNVGTVNLTNLVATLQPTGGVASPGGAQTYGSMPVGSGAVSRDFTFTATGSCGSNILATLTLQDGTTSLGSNSISLVLGSPIVALNQNFDGVTAPALPAGWTATVASGSVSPWATSASEHDSLPNAVFSAEPSTSSDNLLVSPTFAISTTNAQLSFRHHYNFEDDGGTVGYDGGVLEISIGGGSYVDFLSANGSFTSGGYDHTIDSSFGSPIGGRSAWSGDSGTFITTTATLPASAAGQSVRLRWRSTSDASTSGAGWYVDTIAVNDGYKCCNTLVPPVILNPRPIGLSSFAFSYQSVPGQTYFVESITNVTATNWSVLATNAGDGLLKSFTNPAAGSQRHFRLRTQ